LRHKRGNVNLGGQKGHTHNNITDPADQEIRGVNANHVGEDVLGALGDNVFPVLSCWVLEVDADDLVPNNVYSPFASSSTFHA
jgi:hypothetical protein